MTSSNGTFRRTRRNTYLALGLAAVALATCGYLLVQINALDRDYGRIRNDLPHYQGQLSQALEQRDLVRQQVLEEQAELSRLTDAKADLDAELAALKGPAPAPSSARQMP